MQFGQISIDGNMYVFAIVGAFFVLAFVFGEGRLKRVSTALLAGFFVADQLGGFVTEKLSGQSPDASLVMLGILAFVTLGLSLGKAASTGGRFGLRSFILAFLTSATLIAYTHSYLSRAAATEALDKYNLVALAVNNKLYLLAAMTAWLILITVWKRKTNDDDTKGKKGKKK